MSIYGGIFITTEEQDKLKEYFTSVQKNILSKQTKYDPLEFAQKIADELQSDIPFGYYLSNLLAGWIHRACDERIERGIIRYINDEEQDNVNHPSHYTSGSIECIDAIKASMSQEEFNGFLKGNAIKYLWRYKNKNSPDEDLQKSMWYTARLIKEIANDQRN